jgi:hypothetical protein
MNNNINISYTDEFEQLLKEEAEKAESMSILHNYSYIRYNSFSIYINIPVIIISSIIGFLSPIELFHNQSIFLGALSVFVALLKTIDNYFDYTKRSEAHRITSLTYMKISKYIQIQLSLEKDVRIKAKDILDIISNDLQALKDAEPLVHNVIINEYNKKYKDEKTAKPAICNGLTEIKINKKTLIDINQNKSNIDIKIINDINKNPENNKKINKIII